MLITICFILICKANVNPAHQQTVISAAALRNANNVFKDTLQCNLVYKTLSICNVILAKLTAVDARWQGVQKFVTNAWMDHSQLTGHA
ncbi:hypothetical protein TTHERM_00379070 (macronuclear) [Tetrahymena thermophila SB210]|uniref:Transmembrane protein n=1 Tax=Tetrahymena thermophila (strain SB210) TaxID=312017 RepID=Q23FB0_TETTS|nr:hypothetical protein TTHERM_00379070 [Tetrahymena thermophila SB210]EAR95243.2 hypothetical protein TTHERM_00379070 [Tetrahymena thermophila SB210]|eukprot:XP_001015488.2 hypothetical protein TTHERM_00379070 [Tetrahymena thermophila SB210]